MASRDERGQLGGFGYFPGVYVVSPEVFVDNAKYAKITAALAGKHLSVAAC